MAYLPMVLAHAGLSGSLLWRSSSSGFLCAAVPGGVFLAMRVRRLPGDVRKFFHPLVYWLSAIFGLLVIFVQVLNLMGLLFQPQFAAFFLGLVLLLFIGAIQFTRILFARPE